jgi:LEA14-like dessication related protein
MYRRPMKTALWILAAIMMSLAGASGCGVQQLARGEIEPPRVEVKGVSVGLPQSGGLPVFALLELTNPNPKPLDLRGYDYELWLEGRSVARGASSRPVHLPALGRTSVDFPIMVHLPAVLSLAPAALQRQTISYRLAGGFRLGSVMGGLLRVPFHFQGQTTLEEGQELLRLYTR